MGSEPFDKQKSLLRAQTICSRQEKCVSDISKKLYLWGASKTEIDEIISLLLKESFIDQKRYARIFASEKARFNKWGPKKIEFALRAKKIADDDIKSALLEVQDFFSGETISKLLKAKTKSVKFSSTYELKNKLIRFGLSKGFEYTNVLVEVEKILKDDFSD